jgi:putative lipoic acid-binding regulatory protein
VSDRRIPIEELIEFPTAFAFKAIGRHTFLFSQEAFEAAKSALPEDRRVQLSTRLSRDGTYVSVTLTATVESADELRAVYAALWGVEGVITVL